MKFTQTVLALAVAAFVANLANASLVLPLYLTFDGGVHHELTDGSPSQGGGEDALKDESLAKFVNIVDADTGQPRWRDRFDVGDQIFGMITISDIDSSGAPQQVGVGPTAGNGQRVTIVYALEVASEDPIDSNLHYLKPIGDKTDPHDLRNLIDSNLHPFVSLDDARWNDAAFIVLSSLSAPDPFTFNGATAEAEIGMLSASNGWQYEFLAGINLSNGDFYQLVFGSGTPGVPAATYGGFSIIDHAFGGSTVFLPVDVANHDGQVSTHDFTLVGGTLSAGSSSNPQWNFEDGGVFYLNAVPEPSTWLVLLGLGMCVGIGSGWRAWRKTGG